MVELEWQVFEAGFCRHPEVMTQRGGAFRTCEYPALVSLLRHPTQGYVLFDTGYSPHFMRATDPLPERMYRCVTPVDLAPGRAMIEQLGARGIAATDVAHVFVSHFHGDHVGGLPDFASASVICAREAWDDLRTRSRVAQVRKGLLASLLPHDSSRIRWIELLAEVPMPETFRPFVTGRDLFGDGSCLAVELPGHAPGHWGLAFRSNGRWIFLIADAAWSSEALRIDAPPPRITTAWLGDTTRYLRTFRALREIALREPTVLIVPSHCRELRP